MRLGSFNAANQEFMLESLTYEAKATLEIPTHVYKL